MLLSFFTEKFIIILQLKNYQLRQGDMMQYFADFLKQSRKELSLNKVQIAEKFSWTPMYYDRYENEQLLPTKQNIKNLLKY